MNSQSIKCNWIRNSLAVFLFLMPIATMAEESTDESSNVNQQESKEEKLPIFLEPRLYTGSDGAAFGAQLGMEIWNFDWALGGYAPFESNDDSIGDFDATISRRFQLTEKINMQLGIGALDFDDIDVYAQYGLSYAVTENAQLTTGYRFHFSEDDQEQDNIYNKNEFYLGFRMRLNPEDPVIEPEPEPVVIVKEVPAPAPAPEPKVVEIIKETYTFSSTDKGVSFEFGSANLSDTSALDGLVEQVTQEGYSDVNLTVIGHTDSISSYEFNQQLSEKRAQAVKDYLVSKGLDQSSISAIGKGEREPIATNMYKDGRAKNRRVEIQLTASVTKITSETKE